MRRWPVLLAVILAACSADPPPAPISILASDEAGPVAERLETFSTETGIPLILRRGNSADIADALISTSDSQADILITDNVVDIWRAADHGALRPIQSAVLVEQPAVLQDPDRFWAGLEAYSFVVVAAGDGEWPDFRAADLGAPDLAGRLCLVSAARPEFRSLVAFLIDDIGLKEAERLVRRWVRNLAMPPHADQESLLQAVRAGSCSYGIVRVRLEPGAGQRLLEPRYVDVAAIGIGRHARNAEAAQRLVDWLLRDQPKTFGVSPDSPLQPPYRLGWRDEEARLLAARAGYR